MCVHLAKTEHWTDGMTARSHCRSRLIEPADAHSYNDGGDKYTRRRFTNVVACGQTHERGQQLNFTASYSVDSDMMQLNSQLLTQLW